MSIYGGPFLKSYYLNYNVRVEVGNMQEVYVDFLVICILFLHFKFLYHAFCPFVRLTVVLYFSECILENVF